MHQVYFFCQPNIDLLISDFKDLLLHTSWAEITESVLKILSFLPWTKIDGWTPGRSISCSPLIATGLYLYISFLMNILRAQIKF